MGSRRQKGKTALKITASGCAFLIVFIAFSAQVFLTKLSNSRCFDWYRLTAGYWYTGSLAIEAGTGPEQQQSGVQPQGWWEFGHFFMAIVLGKVHAPTPCALGLGSFKSSLEGAESRFCRRMLDTTLMSEMYQVTAERDTADAFLRACGTELAALGDEEQALLEPLRQAGAISEDFVSWDWGRLGPKNISGLNPSNGLLLLNRSDVAGSKPGAVEVLDTAYEGPRLRRSELEELLSASLQYSLGRSGLEGASEREFRVRHQQALEFWEMLDVHGMASLGADLPAVGQALTRGELVRFDARAMLPAAAFNVTAASLAAAEGQQARRIAVLSEIPYLPRSLDFFAKEMAETRLPLGFLKNETAHLPGFVNVRRLPRFAEQLPDVSAALHLTNDVLHAVSILWLGPIASGAWHPSGLALHYDAQANVYVQLAGEADVLLIPPAYTDLFDWWKNILGFPRSLEEMRAWVQSSDLPAKVPFVLAHLRPGDGLTLPSRTYHAFMAQGTERVALNYFFHPRWRRMEYNSTDLASRTKATRLAMNKLALLASQRVWREKGKAVFTDSGRFELI